MILKRSILKIIVSKNLNVIVIRVIIICAWVFCVNTRVWLLFETSSLFISIISWLKFKESKFISRFHASPSSFLSFIAFLLSLLFLCHFYMFVIYYSFHSSVLYFLLSVVPYLFTICSAYYKKKKKDTQPGVTKK
jgi:hypothetical protein